METINPQEEEHLYTKFSDEKLKCFIERLLMTYSTQEQEDYDNQPSSNFQDDNYQLSQLALEAIDGFLFVMSRSGHILFVSPSIETVLKCNKMDVIGGNLFTYAHHEDVIQLQDQFHNHSTGCPAISGSSIGSAISGMVKPQFFCNHCNRQKLSFAVRISENVDRTSFYKLQCSGFIHCTQVAVDKMQSLNQRNNQFGDHYSLSASSRLAMTSCFPLASPNPASGSNNVELVRDIWLTGIARLASKRKSSSLCDLPNGNARMLCDVNGIVQQIDQRFTDITGYAFHEMIGQPIFNYIHEEDVSILKEAQKSAINEGHCHHVLYRLLTKSGSCTWLKSNIGVSRQQNGEIDYLISDNVAIRKAEDKIQASSEPAYQNDTSKGSHGIGNSNSPISDPLSPIITTAGNPSPSRHNDIQYQPSPLANERSPTEEMMDLTTDLDQEIAYSYPSTQHSVALTTTTGSTCPISQSSMDTFDFNSTSTSVSSDNVTFSSVMTAMSNQEPTMSQLHDMAASVSAPNVDIDQSFASTSSDDYNDLFYPATTRNYPSAPIINPTTSTLSMEEPIFQYGHGYTAIPSFTQYTSEDSRKNYNCSYPNQQELVNCSYTMPDTSATMNLKSYSSSSTLMSTEANLAQQAQPKPLCHKPSVSGYEKQNRLNMGKKKSTAGRRNTSKQRQCKIQAKAGNITLLLNALNKRRRLSEGDRQKLMQKMVMSRWLKTQIEYQRQKPKDGPSELEKLLQTCPKPSPSTDHQQVDEIAQCNSEVAENIKEKSNRVRRYSEPYSSRESTIDEWGYIGDQNGDRYAGMNAQSFDDISINRFIEANYSSYASISSPSKCSSASSSSHLSPSSPSNNALTSLNS
ncbi:Aryl hydrocarbon receptor nuclear translocator-like protein 1 [Trichoplax sp. H2]|nr:Aryl hydrocarbon receptor nuclear translocator-like protein 1 [Trichoplax sp. H2]|eukprot:RDD38651.1 Aryl hydrocarbon receptor nuclear translocator-like protein 1 [Trichoplax sp. H2]